MIYNSNNSNNSNLHNLRGEYQEIRDTNNETYNCNICFFSCCIIILYFLLSIPTIFMDIIIGAIHRDDMCVTNPVIDINKWLIINGIFGYIILGMLILLNKVYVEDNFCRKFLKISSYMMNGFMVVWMALGIFSFFNYYYNDKTCMEYHFFYNYVLIRIVISPLLIFLKITETYYS